MKKVYFQQIADNRLSGNISKEIDRLKKETDEALEKIGAVNTASGICNFINFEDGTLQYRVDYIIPKSGKFTYNQLFLAVNKVKPVPFKIK